ncbi:MAG: DUF2510 domain-containing protein [Pseudolysinimonas sp.]
MSATLMTTPAAGWYHDPNDSDSWRWWDGVTWTGHVRPKVETAPVAVASAAPVSQPVATQLPVSQPVPIQQPVSEPVAVQQPVSQPVAIQPVSQPVAIQPVAVQQPVSQPVAVQQPVSQPVPVQPVSQPVTIPQPGGHLSLTPETPASEQEYWHSANAEVVQIPGRTSTSMASNFHSPGGGFGASPYAMREWGAVGSPQTPGIWLLASLPIISIVIQVVFAVVLGIIQGTTGVSATPPNLVYYVILVVLGWIFAGLDVRALRTRGYRAPKIWWMLLLPPLVYFIKRGRVVRAEGQRAWPPELLYFLSITLGGLLVVGAILFAIYMMGGLGALGLPL